MSDAVPDRPALQPPDRPATEPRTVESSELFGSSRVVHIHHAGQWYRLLITRNDKLILQK